MQHDNGNGNSPDDHKSPLQTPGGLNGQTSTRESGSGLATVADSRAARGSSTSEFETLKTPEWLAERWSVSVGFVYKKAAAGEIPKAALPGKVVRFRVDEIERFERREAA